MEENKKKTKNAEFKPTIKLDDLIGKRFKIELPPENEPFGDNLVNELKYYISTWRGKLPFPTNEEVERVWKNRRGTFPKRYKKFLQIKGFTEVSQSKYYSYIYSNNQHKVYSTTLLSNIGSTINRSQFDYLRKEKQSLYFDIVKGPFNSKTGFSRSSHGHPGGSCWFTNDGGSKYAETFHSMNGHCIRFFLGDDEKPIGRIWIIKTKYGLVCFNPYLKGHQDQEIINLVAQTLKLKFKKISVSAATLYTNSGTGLLMYKSNKKEEELPKAVCISKQTKKKAS